MASSTLNPKSVRPGVKLNPFLVTATLVWLAAALYLLFFADLSGLRYGNQEPTTYFLGQVAVLPFIALMLFLARRTGLKPVDHTSTLGLSRTRATLETAWLLAYMFATMGLGMVLNIHNHIHFGAFADGTQSVLGQEPWVSSLLWAGYNFFVYVVLPLAFFMGVRGYSVKNLLLSFPKARVFVPFAVLAGVVGVLAFITPEFWSTPFLGHLLTLLIYSLGTLIPVAVFTQALLAPRLAFLTRSWVTGAVLAGVAYMLFNLNEYFVAWGSAPEVGLSLNWLLAGDLFWGVIKAVSTLALGNAWMHIFTTHTLHLADAPLVARVFGIR